MLLATMEPVAGDMAGMRRQPAAELTTVLCTTTMLRFACHTGDDQRMGGLPEKMYLAGLEAVSRDADTFVAGCVDDVIADDNPRRGLPAGMSEP
jgi:hypothetical protein